MSDYLCRELESWVHDMQTLIAAVELAKDVASAEATLQGHRERKVATTTPFPMPPSITVFILLLG